ncbi:hypothetical protein ACH4C6_14285 [Streptomyces sp. NPDC017943]|uniref:hypothetical protein n=1 Tax=Streptomyces sp. NPDC017943 TaxID=3365019 RepID=UPI0037BA9886
MTQRLRFVLDGDDQLSPVLNGAGDASARLHRRLNDDMNSNARAVRGFTQDADGRLRDLRGRFLSAGDAARMMGSGMPDLARRLGDVSAAGGETAMALGRSGGGLGPVMAGIAAVAGMSLLPAIGALVPMMAGAGLAAGTLTLGFKGVGDAMEAAGKGKEEYAEALKKLSPPARDFTRALVDLKGKFGGIGKDIQAAMLPGFTQAVKAAAPVVKILGRSMTELGGAFGDAAAGVGRMLQDSGFQDSLQQNLKLGSAFVRDMTSAMGPFVRSLLDFGAASQPTLQAFSDGISGLLSKGLPGFFQGLQSGAAGAGKFLDGLFDAVNQLLPAFGRLSGEIATVTGPIFGELFRAFGTSGAGAMDMLRGALVMLRPALRDLGYGLKTVNDIGRIIAPTMRDTGLAILGAFAPLGSKINETAGPLQRLNQWVNNNKGSIMEMARVFANATLEMVSMASQAAPFLIKGFTIASAGILAALGGISAGAAKAFGWMPGIGPKVKAANEAFQSFKGTYLGALATAGKKASDFAASVGPKLSSGMLKLNISNWNSQITEAKQKLKTVPPGKQAALKAHIADLEAKVARAQRLLNGLDGKTADTYTRHHYINITENRTIYTGKGGRGPNAATGGLYTGRAFTHRGYSQGGLVEGPGTETSDDVYAPWLSKNEFVINARRTRQFLPLLKAINSGTFKAGALTGSGAGTAGAGMEAGRGLASGMQGARGLVSSAARLMAASVTQGIRDELEIRSPSKKTTALAKDVGRGLIKGLTGSRDKIKATSKDLAKDIWSAFSGSKDNRLVAYVNKHTKTLLSLAGKRDSIAATIKRAKDFAESTRVGAKQAANLGGMFEGEEQVSAAGINSKLQQRLAKLKTFSSYIKSLAKRGLNKTMLREILTMGPEQGYAYASALAGSSGKLLSEINSTQYKINSQAESLGRAGADALYDSGKNAAKGYLKGLDSQQDAIEKQMVKIAKAMDKAIRKALGIKSPSTVMARLGAYSTQGLARGLTDALPAVDRALGVVTGRVAGARPAMARPAVVGGGGGVMQVNISVTDARDPVATAREIRRELLELKRVFGLNVELKVG